MHTSGCALQKALADTHALAYNSCAHDTLPTTEETTIRAHTQKKQPAGADTGMNLDAEAHTHPPSRAHICAHALSQPQTGALASYVACIHT